MKFREDGWCEYKKECKDLLVSCPLNKDDCRYWHSWKDIDLNNLFKEKVDSDGNYFLDL